MVNSINIITFFVLSTPFQHYLTMIGSTIAIPLILAPSLCISDNNVALAEVIATMFFVSGVATLLQTFVGNRYEMNDEIDKMMMTMVIMAMMRMVLVVIVLLIMKRKSIIMMSMMKKVITVISVQLILTVRLYFNYFHIYCRSDQIPGQLVLTVRCI